MCGGGGRGIPTMKGKSKKSKRVLEFCCTGFSL